MLWRGLAQHQILADFVVGTLRVAGRFRSAVDQTLMMLLQQFLLLMLLLERRKVRIGAAISLRQLLLYGLRQRGGGAIGAHFSPVRGIGIIHGLTLQIQANAAGGHVLLQIGEGRRVTLLLFLDLFSVLLQMLLQVRLLRVGLAAQLANVRLQMLGVLVLGYVLQKRHLIAKALIARVAFERFIRLMAARMRLQIGQLGERLGAAGVPAFVWLIARMGAYVLLQVRQLRELALANLAAVRLDAQMDARVLRQIRRIGKGFTARGALVRLRLLATLTLILRR